MTMTETAWEDLIETVKADPQKQAELRDAFGNQNKGARFPEAMAFKREVDDWLQKHTTQWNSHKQGFNALLRERFDMRNVQNMTDEQVPEARELFEQYKQLFQPKEVSK